MVCSRCGSNEAMYCARCFHSSSGRTAGNTVGTQPTDVQKLKAEIRAISDIIIEYGESGIAVDFPVLKRRLRELSAV